MVQLTPFSTMEFSRSARIGGAGRNGINGNPRGGVIGSQILEQPRPLRYLVTQFFSTTMNSKNIRTHEIGSSFVMILSHCFMVEHHVKFGTTSGHLAIPTFLHQNKLFRLFFSVYRIVEKILPNTAVFSLH